MTFKSGSQRTSPKAETAISCAKIWMSAVQIKDRPADRRRAIWKDTFASSGLPREVYRAVRREREVSIPAADKEIQSAKTGKIR